jgi:hypothetical protein
MRVYLVAVSLSARILVLPPFPLVVGWPCICNYLASATTRADAAADFLKVVKGAPPPVDFAQAQQAHFRRNSPKQA